MLIISGATASGKSSLAVKVAKKIQGEVVSADSMQIYRHMNIGTAKVTLEEMQGVPHHLIDVVEPSEEFSVAKYRELALKKISEIEKEDKIPIVAGGTGLYINALIYPLDFGNAYKDSLLRETLNNELEVNGKEYIFNKLKEIDPIAAEKIHVNNVKRVIRALEVKLLSGKSITEQNNKSAPSCYYKIYICNPKRELLYERINCRVDEMLKNGLLQEVEELLSSGKVNFEHQSMQAIGYKEFKEYFNGLLDITALAEKIKQDTRNYAKRQITWFKSYTENCIWLDEVNDATVDFIVSDYLSGRERYYV